MQLGTTFPLATLTVLLALIGCGQHDQEPAQPKLSSPQIIEKPPVKTVDYLQERNGVFYEVNVAEPFTGNLDSGECGVRATFVKGLHEGERVVMWNAALAKVLNDNARQVASNFNDLAEAFEGLAQAMNPNSTIIRTRQTPKLVSVELAHRCDQVFRRTNYKNGQQDGLEQYFFEDGQVDRERNYKEGKKEGVETTWFRNGHGQKESETNYKAGQQDGLETKWFENGQKESETNYKLGEKDGLETIWYKNGKKKSETKYRMGRKQ